MFFVDLYTIAALALSLAPAAAKSKGDSYHFLNGETCQGGFTPQIQHFPLNSRACLDASTVTSIYIDGATGKTCSYWSEESDCLGKTVTIEHTKKGGCYDVVKTGKSLDPDENGNPIDNSSKKYKSVRYTLGACKEAERMPPL